MASDPRPSPPQRPASRRRVRLLVLGAALLLLLAAVERDGRRILAPVLNLTGEACWIWASARQRPAGPRAFFAVKDFELDEVADRADILVTADESYVLWLNGRRVGSGCYRDGAPLDRYDVTPLLLAGGNRVVVELRSSRGAGGVLLALEEPATAGTRLVSDASWRIFERARPGILEGWLPEEEGEPVFVWGFPPAGRWGRPQEAVRRPRYDEALASGGPRVPVGVSLLRGGGTAAAWRPVARQAVWEGAESLAPLGPQVTFDFDGEVSGYLVLALRATPEQSGGLAWFGREPAEPRPGAFDAAVVPVPGAELWRDAVPRRFRYVTLLGMEEVVGAWVEPLPPARLVELPTPPAATPRGVFGLEPPTLRTPIEDEVRRKLKRVAGVAGGEDL